MSNTFINISLVIVLRIGSLGLAADVKNEAETVPQLVAMMYTGERTTLFVKYQNNDSVTMERVGSEIGPYVLVGSNVNEGYADFRKDTEIFRVRLPESSVKASAQKDDRTVVLPSLHTIRGLLGLEEAIIRAGNKELGEQRIRNQITSQINAPDLDWAQRVEKLQNLISGKTKMIMAPPGKVSDEFARKYQLTPAQVEEINFGESLGLEFQKQEREKKALEKRTGAASSTELEPKRVVSP